ncbi:MAG: hypothetical protein KDI36_18645, partial [Pseudomonadales bacterium]|nr:hypothetical protein [Pseudomonadales bacterium]
MYSYLKDYISLLFLTAIWVGSLIFGYFGYLIRVENMGWHKLIPGVENRLDILFYVLPLLLLMPRRIDKPSSFFLHFFFLSSFVPSILLYVLQNESRSYALMICACFAIMLVLARFRIRFDFRTLNYGKHLALAIAASFVCIVFFRALTAG